MLRTFFIWSFCASVVMNFNVASAADELLPPVHLRTEYLENPLGIDTVVPRFSWWMQHREPNQKQTAYEITVYDSPTENMEEATPLWDSGKVVSDDCVHVEYAGPPLQSRKRYFWRVRTWDAQDRPSAWSDKAWFETALLYPEDFQATWIRGSLDAVENVGYQSKSVGQSDQTQWVQIDLGEVRPVSEVVLYPATKVEDGEPIAGFGFPLRFRIDLASESDQAAPTFSAQSGEADLPNPQDKPFPITVSPPVNARFVRVTATKLYERKPSQYVFALAEVRVSGPSGETLSTKKPVSYTTSQESPPHGICAAYLTDGICHYVAAKTHSPMFRKEFVLPVSVAAARAYVSALGYYELYINGKRIGNHVLDPGDTLRRKRVLYSVYDVTDALRSGPNALGMMLGHGWHHGTCAAWLQLHVRLEDGTDMTIVTDGTWRAFADGPIVEESLYHGETYDARKEQPGWSEPGYDDRHWGIASIYEEPPQRVACQTMPPIRVVDSRQPVRITRIGPDTQILDFGQNLTGWLRIRVAGERGTTVTMRHAEVLYPDGTLNPSNLRSARATDTYILKGEGEEEYAPRFTQHGFRYAEIRGYPGDILADHVQAEVVHTDFAHVGQFETTSPTLNAIRDITLWSIRGNSMSHPTDCPQRDERMGWMGDAHLVAESTLMSFDATAYYENWVRVIADSQDDAGHIPDTAPHFWGEADGSPPWAIAYPLITYYLYRYCGDMRVVAEHYEPIKKWFGTLEAKAKDHIVEYCRYGDWVGLEETPGAVISTGVYYWTAAMLEEFARVLGKSEESAAFAQRKAAIADAFNRHFWDNEKKCYGNGSQFSQIWPVYLCIADGERKNLALQHLIHEIEVTRGGHLATGILGTKYVFDVLTDAGREDLAFRLVFRQEYPSWGYMLNHGATTLWELWQLETDAKMNSHNHQMFGGILGWMMDAIGGIGAPVEPGFRKLSIDPRLPENLAGAQTRVETVRGPVVCSWRKDEDRFWMCVTIPPNTEATVVVPKFKENGTTLMNGQPLPDTATTTNWGRQLRLGSGEYTFTIQ